MRKSHFGQIFRSFSLNMFMFFEPLEGKRHVVVTDQRTAVDWAHQIRNLVDLINGDKVIERTQNIVLLK